jgi:hypothetical protein
MGGQGCDGAAQHNASLGQQHGKSKAAAEARTVLLCFPQLCFPPDQFAGP